MNFTDFIEVELRALQKFSKHTTLVNKVRMMLAKLSTFRQDNRSFRVSIEQNTSGTTRQLLDIATAVFESKNQKIIMHGLIILQKLMNIRKLSTQQYDDIVSHLSCLKQMEDKDLQMRTIQICLNLITPELVLVQNFEFIKKLYHICFYVAFSKDLMTRKIAISAVIQLTQFIFEKSKFSHYDEQGIKRCCGLFNDFLGYLVEQKNQWIPKGLNVIVWDLVLEIIKIQGLNMITDSTNNMERLQKLYDVCLKKSFLEQVENRFDFIRYFRALCFMSVNLKMGVKQLQRLKIISELSAGLSQSLYLEGAIYILVSDLMLTRAHAHPELLILIETLSQLAEQLCLSHQSLKVLQLKPKTYLTNATVLLQIDTTEIVDDAVIYRMLMNALIDLRIRFQTNTIENQGEVKKSFEYMSAGIIKILRYMMMIDTGEKMIRIFIKQYQKWILLACKFKLPKVRNKFLEELFLLTRKLQKRTQVIKCIEATQIMFNLVYGYQNLLDSSSLVIILFCFQQLEEKINKMKKNKEWIIQMSQFEIQNTQAMIEQLYNKDGITFTQQTLKWTLQSLNEITLKVMEELSENPNDKLRMEYKTFGVRKMRQVVEANADKIVLVWNLFIAQFICLSNSKSQEIRKYSIQVLTETISKVLLMNVIPQQQLLSIYFELVKTRFTDVKVSIVQKLKILVENYGYKMEQGSLIQIFKVLKLIQEPEQKKQKDQIQKLMNAENALNELLMKECLTYIRSIESIKELIVDFRIIHSSKSHQYSGVGLLWLIPDHIKNMWVASNPQSPYNEQYLELFSMLFQKLEVIIRQSQYVAMRNSAIHVITQIVGQNISLFTEDYLKFFIKKIFFKLFDETIDKYIDTINAVKDPQNQLDKDRCQTCKQMFTNLIKLLKLYETNKLLDESHHQFVIQNVKRMLKIQRSVFLFYLLSFLRNYQNDISYYKNKNERKQLSQQQKCLKTGKYDESLQSLLQARLQTLDPKDRYIKAKVLGILKQSIEYYNRSK